MASSTCCCGMNLSHLQCTHIGLCWSCWSITCGGLMIWELQGCKKSLVFVQGTIRAWRQYWNGQWKCWSRSCSTAQRATAEQREGAFSLHVPGLVNRLDYLRSISARLPECHRAFF